MCIFNSIYIILCQKAEEVEMYFILYFPKYQILILYFHFIVKKEFKYSQVQELKYINKNS